MERDIKSKQSLLDFGGVYDSTSNVFAHDDLLDVGDVSEEKFDVVSNYYHVGLAAMCLDVSYDGEENSESCQSKFGFPLCANKSSKDNFKVHSDIVLDGENDYDQNDLCQHFHDSFSDLVTN